MRKWKGFISGCLISGVLVLIQPVMALGQEVSVTPDPISGRATTVKDILPADVLARAQLFRAELEELRLVMGRPQEQREEIQVTHAAPREVYFQVRTLYQKANRLAYEQTGELKPELDTVSEIGTIRPYHVWEGVNAALVRLLAIQHKLGLTDSLTELAQDPAVTPTDVYQAVVQANREINLLLVQQVASRDVYQQVTLAMNYGARLLSSFPGARRLPESVVFEPRKQPGDVYQRLTECYVRIRTIADQSGLQMLQFEQNHTEVDRIRSSDVYDFTSLIVAEMAFIHSGLRGAKPPVEAYDPGLRFPSHVYQRASMLLAQLKELEYRVKGNPTWLKG